jgi:hypothetical protein
MKEQMSCRLIWFKLGVFLAPLGLLGALMEKGPTWETAIFGFSTGTSISSFVYTTPMQTLFGAQEVSSLSRSDFPAEGH